jgi:hypothetical protein
MKFTPEEEGFLDMFANYLTMCEFSGYTSHIEDVVQCSHHLMNMLEAKGISSMFTKPVVG